MAKTMTPSPMTDGQIDKAVGLYRTVLEKHRDELGSESVQRALGQSEFVGEMIGVLRRRAEAVSKVIIRRVRVDRTRTPQEVLDATGRTQYIDRAVVSAMPKGEGDEAEVFFFKPRPEVYRHGVITDDALEAEFEFYGFKPVDPYSLSAINEADPNFADEHPNGTHWKDSGDKWCYSAFDRWVDVRRVSVHRHDGGWGDDWWFAGLRK